MTDAQRNTVHVLSMFGAYLGSLFLLAELYTDLPRWRRQWRETSAQRALRSLERLDADALRKIAARLEAENRQWNRPVGAR